MTFFRSLKPLLAYLSRDGGVSGQLPRGSVCRVLYDAFSPGPVSEWKPSRGVSSFTPTAQGRDTNPRLLLEPASGSGAEGQLGGLFTPRRSHSPRAGCLLVTVGSQSMEAGSSKSTTGRVSCSSETVMGFPGTLRGEELASQDRRRRSDAGVWKDSPGGGNGNPLRYSGLGESYGRRSLVGLQSMGSRRLGHDSVIKQQTTSGCVLSS